MNPRPARRRHVRAIRCALISADAGELEIASEVESVRINGNNREFFGAVCVGRRTGIEIFVPLVRQGVAGVEYAVVRLIGNRLSGSKIVDGPQIRLIIIVPKGLVVYLEIQRIGCTRRNSLGIAGMQAVTGVTLENIDRPGARQPGTEITGGYGQP